jgi:MYXO-CTERM domain-containing protein
VVAVLALAAAVVATPGEARANSCGKPDLVDMVPPDGATGVPLNARLGAHYATAAEYQSEEIVLVHPDGSEQVMRACSPPMATNCATWDPTEQLLQVTLTDPLTPQSAYEIQWPALRAINAAAPGVGNHARFTTGSTNDTAPPTFAGVTGLDWDLERTKDACTDDLVERYVFDLQLGEASDDGGAEGLSLLLFQTKGPRLSQQMPVPLPARAWPQGSAAGHVQVRLVTELGVGDVCFAGVVRDTTGALSAGGDVEACVRTTAPPFFRGCSVAGNSADDVSLAMLAFALMALPLRRRPRRLVS